MHGRHQKTHFGGEMTAQGTYAIQQLSTLLLVDQWDELEANLESQLFQLERVRQIGALRLRHFLLLAGAGLDRWRQQCRRGDAACAPEQSSGHRKKRKLGQTG